MRTTVAYPGGGAFAQQIALAFQERGLLDAFVTGIAFNPNGGLANTLARLGPPGHALVRELGRRSTVLDPTLVQSAPFWEVVRLAAMRSGASPVLVDRIWDRFAYGFDERVAQRHVPRTQAIYAYEYTAKASFERAKQEGVRTLLDLPSLNSRAFDALQRRELARFPELRSRHDAYFDRRFPARQARRDLEIELADVIIANSSLTRRSHIAGGADPDKFVVMPLAAPPAIDRVERAFAPEKPLKVLWAGKFSLGKGAHLLLDALRLLPSSIELDVYGAMQLPASMIGAVDGVVFHGPQPQSALFAAFETADVLIFPTLSDGFGLVVGEAFARGLPVITTDQAGAADLVKPWENGLIIPAGDVAAIQRALAWCLDNREALHRMRFEALTTAQGWQWRDYRRALFDALNAKLGSLSAPS